MDKTLFTNALLVTPDGVKKGELLTEDGIIRDISDGGAQGASGAEVIDLKGDYLIPGIIELHTDNLEKHLMPRPKIDWPDARSAVFAHDAQIIAAGITTVCDAMSVGEYYDKGRVAMMGRAIAALSEARGTGMLRSDHYLHLRCELPGGRDLCRLIRPRTTQTDEAICSRHIASIYFRRFSRKERMPCPPAYNMTICGRAGRGLRAPAPGSPSARTASCWPISRLTAACAALPTSAAALAC